jgi:hypothetical protein
MSRLAKHADMADLIAGKVDSYTAAFLADWRNHLRDGSATADWLMEATISSIDNAIVFQDGFNSFRMCVTDDYLRRERWGYLWENMDLKGMYTAFWDMLRNPDRKPRMLYMVAYSYWHKWDTYLSEEYHNHYIVHDKPDRLAEKADYYNRTTLHAGYCTYDITRVEAELGEITEETVMDMWKLLSPYNKDMDVLLNCYFTYDVTIGNYRFDEGTTRPRIYGERL